MPRQQLNFGPVVFFGASYRLAQAIINRFNLVQVVCETRSFSPQLYTFAKVHDINFVESNCRETLIASLPQCTGLGISCGFGLIFRPEEIGRFAHGIWNIHFGELPQFRGRHPVGWTLLEGLTKTAVTVHSIDSRIDQGTLLAESHVEIDLYDDEAILHSKLEEAVISSTLDHAIIAAIAGKSNPIGEGRYLQSLQGRWDIIDPVEHNAPFVFNLIRSKRSFGGITIGSRRYRYCEIVNPAHREKYASHDFFICADGQEIAVK